MDTDEQISVYDLFILSLCFVVLIAMTLPLFIPLDDQSKEVLWYMDTLACVVFIGDFVYKLYVAKNRIQFLKWGWIDLVSSIPSLDWARWGRLARIFRVLRLLRALRSAHTISKFLLRRRSQSSFAAACLFALVLITVSSVAVLEFERDADSPIRTSGDALWWAVVTITTVGYGDKYPVTAAGRIVATVLMVGGVGMFGTFSGLIASWCLTPEEEAEQHELIELRASVQDLHRKLDSLMLQSKSDVQDRR